MRDHNRLVVQLFTVFATGLLIHNETLTPRLSWTSKFASIVPGWDLQDPVAAKQATITDAMSHRTGLPRHDASYKWSDDIFSIVSTFVLKAGLHRLSCPPPSDQEAQVSTSFCGIPRRVSI